MVRSSLSLSFDIHGALIVNAGWALTLLSPQNLSYASTAQTVGLTGGHFLSHTVFLAFNSPDFANRWFRSSPSPEGVMTLGGYLTFWGWAYLLVTLGLAVLKREDKTKERDGILEVYKSMVGVLKLKNIQSIIIIHLIAKIGFQANDAVTNLKLLDKGFSQEDMALTVLRNQSWILCRTLVDREPTDSRLVLGIYRKTYSCSPSPGCRHDISQRRRTTVVSSYSHCVSHLLDLHEYSHVRSNLSIPRQDRGSYDWGHVHDIACYVSFQTLLNRSSPPNRNPTAFPI